MHEEVTIATGLEIGYMALNHLADKTEGTPMQGVAMAAALLVAEIIDSLFEYTTDAEGVEEDGDT